MFAVSPRLDDCGLIRLSDDLFNPLRSPAPYCGNISLAAGRETEVQNTDKEFRVRLDLKHYKPEEVKISADKHRVTITARHEEKQDHHGFVTREMTRIYTLPEDVDPKSVTSSMNSQGVLSIKADKQAIEAPKETAIPVEFEK